jgi:tRNA A37 methylthiotransferase MiaB
MTRRIYIKTYGCQMNVADSELMLGQLRAAGFQREAPGGADVTSWHPPSASTPSSETGWAS